MRDILPPYMTLTNKSLPRSSVPKICPLEKLGFAESWYQSVWSMAKGLNSGPKITNTTMADIVTNENSAALFCLRAPHASAINELLFFICSP